MEKGFGLTAVTERLELLFGDNYSFKIAIANGTKVTLVLPSPPKRDRVAARAGEGV